MTGPLPKNCKVNLHSQLSDGDDTTLYDPSHTISQMSHTLTTSTPVTDLTFKTILKELVCLAIGNIRAFHQKLQSTPKTLIQLSMSHAHQVVMPVVTTVTSTSSPSTISLPTPAAICPENALHSVNPNRGPPWTG